MLAHVVQDEDFMNESGWAYSVGVLIHGIVAGRSNDKKSRTGVQRLRFFGGFWDTRSCE